MEIETVTTTSKKNNIPLFVMLTIIFLAPLFVLPASVLSVNAAKMLVFAFGGFSALGIGLLAVMRKKTHLPRVAHRATTVLLYSAATFFVSYVVSSLVSGEIIHTFFGAAFERDSVMSMLVYMTICALGFVTVTSTRSAWRIWQALVGSFVVLALFQLVRVFVGADVVLPALFSTDPTATLLGSWNDLAVFAGMITLLLLAGIVSGVLKKGIMSTVSYVLLALAMLILLLVNLSVVWLVLAILSFAMSAYVVLKKKTLRTTNLIAPLAVFAITATFVAFGSSLGGFLGDTFNIQHVDVRPSWGGTYTILQGVYAEHALFGSGPNTFAADWALYKPTDVYLSDFWNVDFTFGIGFAPTLFVTSGLIGGMLFTVFSIVALLLAVRLFARQTKNSFLQYFSMAFASSSVFLLALTWVYVPGSVVLAYTFLMVGVTAALLNIQDAAPASLDVPAINEHTLLQRIFVTTGIVVCVVAFVGYADRAVANVLANRAAVADTIEAAERLSAFADAIDISPMYTTLRAQISTLRIQELIATTPENEEERAVLTQQLQETINATLEYARATALAYERNYRSWIALANTYASIMPLGVEGAYEGANAAYENALAHSPSNPLVYLSQANMAYTNKDVQRAEEYAGKAIASKENYVDAYYFLANLYTEQDSLVDAIAASEAATLIEPNNTMLLYRLGVLQFLAGEHEKAQAVLERAVILVPDYANALYFLGLSYEASNEKEQSLQIFERIAELNPDNEEVQAILQRLRTPESSPEENDAR